MIISDLNYLENASEEVVVGGAFTFDNLTFKHGAFAQAGSTATGNNTFTYTFTNTIVTANSSTSVSQSAAAAN